MSLAVLQGAIARGVDSDSLPDPFESRRRFDTWLTGEGEATTEDKWLAALMRDTGMTT